MSFHLPSLYCHIAEEAAKQIIFCSDVSLLRCKSTMFVFAADTVVNCLQNLFQTCPAYRQIWKTWSG